MYKRKSWSWNDARTIEAMWTTCFFDNDTLQHKCWSCLLSVEERSWQEYCFSTLEKKKNGVFWCWISRATHVTSALTLSWPQRTSVSLARAIMTDGSGSTSPLERLVSHVVCSVEYSTGSVVSLQQGQGNLHRVQTTWMVYFNTTWDTLRNFICCNFILFWPYVWDGNIVIWHFRLIIERLCG